MFIWNSALPGAVFLLNLELKIGWWEGAKCQKMSEESRERERAEKTGGQKLERTWCVQEKQN